MGDVVIMRFMGSSEDLAFKEHLEDLGLSGDLALRHWKHLENIAHVGL